ncbi:MAG: carboxypeptidase regulatory-like domain-containing protein [Pyrinomonadaceae bacterium]
MSLRYSPRSQFLFIFALLYGCAFFGSATPARAQDTLTGAFEGTVTNTNTGAVVAGATALIINQQTGQVIGKTSDARGRFYQGLLAPGLYTIRVSAPGFQTREVVQRLFITRTGEVVPVPVSLDPVSAASAVSAAPTPTPTPLSEADTDIRARINATDARQSGSFTEEVSTLPLGSFTLTRTFDELTLLLPGVAPPPQTLGSVAGPGVGAGVGSAGQFAANGLRSRANNFTVDGSDNNDEDIGVRRQGFVALIPQPIESVKEYQAITLLAPAQFGRNIGAQVNAVSRSGGSETHGTFYGFFNSSQLNARNFFDTTSGNQSVPLRAGGKPVIIDGRTGSVTNESGGEDSFTLAMGGFVLGGALEPPRGPDQPGRMFYFISAEALRVNATREANFAVPTVRQRGIFDSGADGLSRNPFNGNVLCDPTDPRDRLRCAVPATISGDAIFSLFPFPNQPQGIYGENTFTRQLPADEEGKIVSGKFDANFRLRERQQSFTSRINFTDDFRDIPVTGGALFSTLHPRVRTQNLSNFLNSELSGPNAARPVFNQLRASYGRTRLVFDERRDARFQTPSRLANQFRPEDRQFLLNAPLFINDTLPNSNSVFYDSFFNFTAEDILGPVGQVNIAGFSPLGVDVFNFPQRRVNNTYQLADTLTARISSHSLTLGADFRRTELNSDLPRNARPLIVFGGAPNFTRTPQGIELRGFISPIDLAAASAPSGVFQALTPGSGSAINLRYYQYNYFAQDDWRPRRNLSISYGLRYEYNTPPFETNRRIEDTFGSPALALAPGLETFYAGRTSIFDPDRNNFAPRVGLAYAPRLLGAKKTSVIRAGFGVFYDQALGAVVSQSRNVFPNFLTLNLAGGRANAGGLPGTGFNITDPSRDRFPCVDTDGTARFPLLVQPGTLNTLNPLAPLSCLVNVNRNFPGGFGITLPERRLEMPEAYHYTLAFEQLLSNSLVISVSYVGTQGRHLLRLTTPNLGPNAFLIPTDINLVGIQPNVSGFALGPGERLNLNGGIVGGRPVRRAGAVFIYESSANSNYNALQLQARGRLRRSLQYQLAYTFSKALDDVSDIFELAGAPALPQDSFDLRAERGPANFDARHRFAYNFIYDLPDYAGRGAPFRLLFGGLQIAGTGRLQTGQPFTVNGNFDVNLDGNLTDRLNTTDGLIETGDRRQPLRLAPGVNQFDLLAPLGRNGAIGRNTFRAGNIVELDLSFVKNFNFTTRQRLIFRTDIFNFINRSNYGVPVRFLGAPGFGQVTETLTPGRRIQFALKYSF